MLNRDKEVTPLSPISTDRVMPKATPSAPSPLSVSGSPKNFPVPSAAAQTPLFQRMSAAVKRIITGRADVNRLTPFTGKRASDKGQSGFRTRISGPLYIKALFHKTVELEFCYAEDTMPRGVRGMNTSMFKTYRHHIANQRTSQIRLIQLSPSEKTPFPWMSEMIDLKKARNFFETRVIEYQPGGALAWG